MGLATRTFSDIDMDFMPNPITDDILKKTNENAIAQSIGNLLQTAHYERLFNPELGCNLKRYLFEPIDNITTNNIIEEITKTIVNYETRVSYLMFPRTLIMRIMDMMFLLNLLFEMIHNQLQSPSS